jgi:hypothetical protein
MAEDEDARREARRAQLLAALNPQSGQAQDQVRQQMQQVRDLSQMRPVVQQSVSEQERRATQVVTATFQLFRDAIDKSRDPTLRRDFRESSLSTMLG